MVFWRSSLGASTVGERNVREECHVHKATILDPSMGTVLWSYKWGGWKRYWSEHRWARVGRLQSDKLRSIPILAYTSGGPTEQMTQARRPSYQSGRWGSPGGLQVWEIGWLVLQLWPNWSRPHWLSDTRKRSRKWEAIRWVAYSVNSGKKHATQQGLPHTSDSQAFKRSAANFRNRDAPPNPIPKNLQFKP